MCISSTEESLSLVDLYFMYGWKYYLLYEYVSVRKLVFGFSRMGGSNHLGSATLYHSGGGCKRKYRLVDFLRSVDSFGLVLNMDFDPNRSGLLALVCYFSGMVSYVLASSRLTVGDVLFSGSCVWSGSEVHSKLMASKSLLSSLFSSGVAKNFFVDMFQGIYLDGSAMPLKEISTGLLVYNVESRAGKGGKLARAAGTSVLVVRKMQDKVLLKLSSGFMVYVSKDCYATIGTVSNVNHSYSDLLKAGVSSHLGSSPVVRGVAMNPVDHPHGGGEGKSSGSSAARTPWGKLTKGKSTVFRKNKRHIFSKVS